MMPDIFIPTLRSLVAVIRRGAELEPPPLTRSRSGESNHVNNWSIRLSKTKHVLAAEKFIRSAIAAVRLVRLRKQAIFSWRSSASIFDTNLSQSDDSMATKYSRGPKVRQSSLDTHFKP